MKYRKLEPHEIIRAGDIAWCHPTAPEDGSGLTAESMSAIGERADYCPNFHYRPIQDNWIAFKDRGPTHKDRNKNGYIIVHDGDGAVYFTTDLIMKDEAYWMPLNFVPREAPLVKVDGKTLAPQKDGSVKLSCGTVIPAEDVKEFIRQYQEVTK